MKKFNSILAIAAVALTSVFGFTSCDKNDDAINQQPVPMEKTTVELKDSYLLVAATAEQMKYMDATFTISTSNETMQVKMSDMSEAKESKYNEFKTYVMDQEDAFNDDEVKDDVKILEFNLGKVFDAKVTSKKYYTICEEPDHEINLFYGSFIVKEGDRNNKIDVRYFKAIHNLEGFSQNLH